MTTQKQIQYWWNSRCHLVEILTREEDEAGIICTHGQAIVGTVLGTVGGFLTFAESPSILSNFVGLAILGATYYIVSHLMKKVADRRIRISKPLAKAA